MRHREGAPNAAALEAIKSAADASQRKKTRSVRGVSDAAFLERLDELKDMLARARFDEASGIHFVALYADLHFRVYKVEAGDLAQKERVYATKLAEGMLARDFGGDRAKMAEFVSWTWSRENGREAWRRETKNAGGRITWRAQFGKSSLLTDYRIDQARKKAAP